MILVTGGTGLVGSHLLLDLLKSGQEVRAIYRKNSSLEKVKHVFSYYSSEKEARALFNKITWVEADITNIPSLEKAFLGVKKVYHCAALISFNPSEYRKLRKINIEGTANVVNFCIKNNIEKLCFVSSIATLDKKEREKEITESSGWNKEKNHSIYAITKYGAEMEVWRASQEGIPVVIVNPGIIIGPGFWDSGSGLMFKKIQNGLKYYFPKVTGFVGVKDVVSTMRQLMGEDIKNEQFLLVSENSSFKEILRQVANSINRPKPKRKLQPWMISLGWLFQKIFKSFGSGPKLSRQSHKILYEETFYNSQKVKKRLNFEFRKVSGVIAETGSYYESDLK